MLPFAIPRSTSPIAIWWRLLAIVSSPKAFGMYSELENGNRITPHENRDDGSGELKCLGSGKPIIIEQVRSQGR